MASTYPFVKQKVASPGRRLLLLVLFAALSVGLAGAQEEVERFDYSDYARVLEQYVTPSGQVRYAALKQNPGDLNAFLGRLAAVSPENRRDLFPAAASQISYWINAYNAFVLHAVVEAYPIKSVRDFKFGFGLLFFKRAKFLAGGRKYSLDDIEHGILRQQFAEPRVHFAVNCASTSCPRLRSEPFFPDRLDAQLEQAAQEFISREENVWMRGDVLFLSKIFDWYEEDFLHAVAREGKKKPTVVDYVLRYLPEQTRESIRSQQPRVEFYNYDWALNDAGRAD